MLLCCTSPAWSPSSIRHRRLLSVPWWCRLCTQNSTTATWSWSDFQHIYSGASSPFLNAAARLVFRLGRYDHISWTLLVVADFSHHHISCLFHHSGSQSSVDAHFQSLNRSSGTRCHLTSNHPRLCQSSANV